MEELLTNLRKAEQLVAEARKAVDSIDLGESTQFLIRCRELKDKAAAVEKSIAEKKLCLLSALYLTSVHLQPGNFEVQTDEYRVRVRNADVLIATSSERESIRIDAFAGRQKFSGNFWIICTEGVRVVRDYLEKASSLSWLEKEADSLHSVRQTLKELEQKLAAN